MVGDHINYANNGINDEAGKRLFNLLNCLLLAEKRPATLNMLDAAYLEVIAKRYSKYSLQCQY